MHKDELANWQTIKDKMEESGNTDNHFYKRACIIVEGGTDPLELPIVTEEE